MKKPIRILALLLVIGSCAYLSIKLFEVYALIGTVAEVNSTPDGLGSELSAMFLKYQNNEVPNINLSKVTDFHWDKVYVFKPYTSLLELDRKVGRSWRSVCVTQIETLEGYTLLMFTQDGEVVRCLEYPTSQYDFSTLAQYPTGIPIQEAVFGLDEIGRVVLIIDN